MEHVCLQHSENSLLSDDQWNDLEQFFQNPELRVAILCSETPFVGDEPGTFYSVPVSFIFSLFLSFSFSFLLSLSIFHSFFLSFFLSFFSVN